MKKVKIVGSGISGLSIAYFLVKKNIPVEIYEKSAKPGGLLQTEVKNNFIVEPAANAFLASKTLEDISEEIGCELLVTEDSAKKRFLFIQNQMSRWPLSLMESFWFLWRLICFILSSQRAPRDLESVESWGERKFGQAFTEKILSTFLQGVYAGDIKEMSASYIYKSLFVRLPKKNLRGSVAPRRGMQEWCVRLTEYLKQQGVVFHYNTKIEKLNQGELSVLAMRMDEAFSLLGLSHRLVMLPLVRVTVGFKQPQKKIEGFGVLIHPQETLKSLGVLSNNYIFKQESKVYNESWILGGVKFLDIDEYSDEKILDLVQQDRQKLLGAIDEFSESYIHRWPQALPHTTIAFEKLMKELRLPPGVWLTGNYVGGIGLTKIIEYNKNLAGQISDQISNQIGGKVDKKNNKAVLI